jgi:hypothetical protein
LKFRLCRTSMLCLPAHVVLDDIAQGYDAIHEECSPLSNRIR